MDDNKLSILEKRKEAIENELEAINKAIESGSMEPIDKHDKGIYYDRLVDDFYNENSFPDLEDGLSTLEKKTLEYFSDDNKKE